MQTKAVKSAARRVADFHERVASEIPQITRGMVWCKRCGREQRVNGAIALRNGWPECCGETMTIDSPQEQARLARIGELG